jgi:DNA-binding Lrp family transcriptional regulator
MTLNPETVRNLAWEEIQGCLSGIRERVYRALSAGGPQTTRDLAAATGDSLLTVRPRVTELVDLGLARCTGRQNKEGVYQAVDLDAARAAHAARHVKQTELQLNLEGI